ncbi:hypothetical protein BCV70DRAFT_57148 [Testicularia cyperi]|uniref:Uncharacterized protein n=1 Tax=Testicularia cyperi TaxID=1882483 RepID=A0A317XUZ0_9BASI|nr:hypothetical protein BCV70DRAFT_57148 [Testicularia cyperi]
MCCKCNGIARGATARVFRAFRAGRTEVLLPLSAVLLPMGVSSAQPRLAASHCLGTKTTVCEFERCMANVMPSNISRRRVRIVRLVCHCFSLALAGPLFFHEPEIFAARLAASFRRFSVAEAVAHWRKETSKLLARDNIASLHPAQLLPYGQEAGAGTHAVSAESASELALFFDSMSQEHAGS